jgi:histidinol-phosphate aminotransferase
MTDSTPSKFRPAIDAMAGYVPGEQPKDKQYVKLNTNENPYPPSPKVAEALKSLDPGDFRRYPDPISDDLRDAAAAAFGVSREWILAGNGSDDILTIAVRSFVDQGGRVAAMDPSYSLYPVLAEIQGASHLAVPLESDFSLPSNLLEQIEGADIFFLTRPNAPSGNTYPLETIERICRGFAGVVFIDEAYADFADDSCLHLAKAFDNVIVSRTLSKSYALAGLRVGFAVAAPVLVDGMMKVKDSYNLNRVSQVLGAAALRDPGYLDAIVGRIKATRERTGEALFARGFEVVPSQANFLFARPKAGIAAEKLFTMLRARGILVRYFGGSVRTREYLRITVGTDTEMDRLIEALDDIRGS